MRGFADFMARFYAENVEFLSPMFRGDFMLDLEPEREERRARGRPRECVQGSAIRWTPGCVNAAGKLGQKR